MLSDNFELTDYTVQILLNPAFRDSQKHIPTMINANV